MKNFGKLFLLGCLAMGLAACNNEEVAPKGEDLSNNSVYMQVKLDLPQTRSKTDEVGTPSDADTDNEQGTAEENKISNLQLVLVDAETKAEIGRSIPGLTPAGVDMYIAPFNSKELVQHADPNQEKNVLIYAICNTSVGERETLEDAKSVKGTPEATWAANNFWMTNSAEAVGVLPKQSELALHNTVDNPVVIGSVEVERVAARFDFAKDHVTFNMNNDKDVNDAKIVLTDMAMFNIADQAFKVRRISADGLIADAQLAGKETPANYVVDVPSHGFSAVNKEELVWQKISELGRVDQWTDNMTEVTGSSEYYFYRYGVENTFAKGETQTQGNATGIAFKGEVQAVPGTALAAAMNGVESVYIFNNVLYGNWARVALAANGGDRGDGTHFAANEALKGAYEAALKLIADDGVTADEDAKVAKAAKTAGFKVLKAEGGKYPVYYNYYNRHNDNGNVKESGPMEFAVVRNNVYKLKVNTISKYGDPEWVKPNPDKPIEQDEIFFQVTVKILPWTVRVNNIDF